MDNIDIFAEGTFDCSNEACLYNRDGRCIYNVSPIKVSVSRACYEELKADYIEAEHDYEEGLLIL